MQFHILSFEGPDAYAMVGGLATRVEGLTQALAASGFETHLWFVGDPWLPSEECHSNLQLHRWCQFISRERPGGVYDGEDAKSCDYATSLPPVLLHKLLLPYVSQGGRAVVIAEEWQTANAVLHLDRLLREANVRRRVAIFWNANNTFGFHRIDWARLREAAIISTVSRYMRHSMLSWGVDPVVIPNGLDGDAFRAPEPAGVAQLRRVLRDRTVITKMARWDPGKRWLGSIGLVKGLKDEGWRPLLIARGGREPYGADVLAAARETGLNVVERENSRDGVTGLLAALDGVQDADVVSLQTHIGPNGRRVLFRSADAVLANSIHEPFGLVGLEAMAAGGIVCTGCSGEDYVISGRNALVLHTDNPHEFMELYGRLRRNPREVNAMRRAGRSTARYYAWPEVLQRNLLPRVELSW